MQRQGTSTAKGLELARNLGQLNLGKPTKLGEMKVKCGREVEKNKKRGAVE